MFDVLCGDFNIDNLSPGKSSNNPKNLDTRKIAIIILGFEQCGFTIHIQKMQTGWQTL